MYKGDAYKAKQGKALLNVRNLVEEARAAGGRVIASDEQKYQLTTKGTLVCFPLKHRKNRR